MTPLIPRIESAKVGSKSLAYLIRPGSDFRGDRIRCDTGSLFFFYCFAYAHAMEIGGGEEERAVDVDNNVSEESDRERWQGRSNLADSSAEQLSKVLQTRRR